MSKTRQCRLYLVDAFTRERFTGNPAATVSAAVLLAPSSVGAGAGAGRSARVSPGPVGLAPAGPP